jgi:hypothetical protein
MNTDVESIDAALAAGGWRAGAEALVAGWVDHQPDEIGWEETWEPDDRCREVFERPGGERVVIEWVSGDTWELSIEWPEGWGREHVSMRLARGPCKRRRSASSASRGRSAVRSILTYPWARLHARRGRRLPGDVELRFELLREDLAAFFSSHAMARSTICGSSASTRTHLPAALDSLERTPRCAPSLWVKADGEAASLGVHGLASRCSRVRGSGRKSYCSRARTHRPPSSWRTRCRPPRVRGEARDA